MLLLQLHEILKTRFPAPLVAIDGLPRLARRTDQLVCQSFAFKMDISMRQTFGLIYRAGVSSPPYAILRHLRDTL